MHPVLDDFTFGNSLEEQARGHTRGISTREIELVLRRQRVVVLLPRGKALRDCRYDVPQHLAPEGGEARRFRAVEGHLELLDR
jgi:hypothetical protein